MVQPAAWGDIPGVTERDGRPWLPRDPALVVDALATLLAEARAGRRTHPELVEAVRGRRGGDRARLGGLVAWVAESRVARWREDGTLDIHPGTHLQDLAFRLGAAVGPEEAPPEHLEALKRWVHEVMRHATAHPQALTRHDADPEACRAWLAAGGPALGPDHDVPPPGPRTRKIRRILEHLDGALLERGTHLRAVFLALLAGQHALLLGPPGTAKSLLARALCAAVDGADYFEYLLSRFTHPDELFGPVSIPGLKDEDYRRLTEGFLPRAHVAFLDEIFKANSSILNSLLTLVNERVFHHGRHRDPAPLLGLVGASNELPAEGEGLEALYDRFLVRLSVPPLGGEAAFLAVATGELDPPELDPADRLTLDEIGALRADARAVGLGADVRQALADLWRHAREAGWQVSDRRWRQAVDLLKVGAAADGRDRVDPLDLLLLEPCLVADPVEAPEVRAAILDHLQPSAAPTHDLHAQWTLLWSDRVAPTPDDPVPPGDPPARWPHRLDRRRAAVDRFLEHHARAVERLGREREALEALGDRHLWLVEMPTELLEPHLAAARDLAAWLRRAERYRSRIQSPEAVIRDVVGWLSTEDRLRPEHMDAVLRLGPDEAVGLAYRQWRRLPAPYDGPCTVHLDATTVLDWLDGHADPSVFLAGVVGRDRQRLAMALEPLHQALAPRLLPAPDAPGRG
jgi:MoxR-like ATPase